MKKKLVGLMFAMFLVLPCSILLASCGSSKPVEATVSNASYSGTAYIDVGMSSVTPTASVTYKEQEVAGTWAWDADQTLGSKTTYTATFTPEDTSKYETLTATITITDYTYSSNYTYTEGDTLTIASGTTFTLPADLTGCPTITNNGTLAVSTEAGLEAAFAAGGNISLLEDISLTGAKEIDTEVFVNLNLNGKIINCTEAVTTGDGADATTTYTSYRIFVSGSLTISDETELGTITSKSVPIELDGGVLTLNSGNIVSTGNYGVAVFYDATVTVNDGTIQAYYGALSGNNTLGGMNFYINGGTLSSEVSEAIYMPNQTNLVVTGGTINGGIMARMGQISISGGTINGMTSTTDSIVGIVDSQGNYGYQYSGHVWLGNALSVMAGTYPSTSIYGNTCNISITGGTLNGLAQNGIVIYDIANNYDQVVNLSISGATITDNNTNEGYSIYVYKVYENSAASYTPNHTVTTTITIDEEEYELTSTGDQTAYLYYPTKKVSA